MQIKCFSRSTGVKKSCKTPRSVKLTHSFFAASFCQKMKMKRKKTYFYVLNVRFEQLMVDYIPTQTRSQAVARIADYTASQQTVYKLATVPK